MRREKGCTSCSRDGGPRPRGAADAGLPMGDSSCFCYKITSPTHFCRGTSYGLCRSAPDTRQEIRSVTSGPIRWARPSEHGRKEGFARGIILRGELVGMTEILTASTLARRDFSGVCDLFAGRRLDRKCDVSRGCSLEGGPDGSAPVQLHERLPSCPVNLAGRRMVPASLLLFRRRRQGKKLHRSGEGRDSNCCGRKTRKIRSSRIGPPTGTRLCMAGRSGSAATPTRFCKSSI